MVAIIKAPRRIGVYPYESPCDGVSSDSEAFNRAVLDIIAEGSKPGSWVIEIGSTLVLDQPTPVLDRHMIVGDGVAASAVYKRFPGGKLFRFEGRAGYSGGAVMGLSVPLDSGSAGSYTIFGRARPDGYAPDLIRLEDLYLGSGLASTGLPFRHIDLIGTARTSPPGIREARIADITCFGCTSTVPIYLESIMGGNVSNVGVFPTPPTSSSLYAYYCIETLFDGLNIDGPVMRYGNTACGFFDKSGAAIP